MNNWSVESRDPDTRDHELASHKISNKVAKHGLVLTKLFAETK